ncbi:MAG: ATP-dependent Clp protease, ATP-binding subunit ClpC, partial [uncultured Corynebacteriales bacterium]
ERTSSPPRRPHLPGPGPAPGRRPARPPLRRRAGRRAARRPRRPPRRPLRRPGPPRRRLLDRHRAQHGGHQAGGPAAVRAAQLAGRAGARQLGPVHRPGPQRDRRRPGAGPGHRARADPARPHPARAAARRRQRRHPGRGAAGRDRRGPAGRPGRPGHRRRWRRWRHRGRGAGRAPAVLRGVAQAARAHPARSAAAGPQLHRHRARPAGPAARREHARYCAGRRRHHPGPLGGAGPGGAGRDPPRPDRL